MSNILRALLVLIVDCTHVSKLDENQNFNIASPLYPSPYPSGLHCNWLISLPKPNTPVALVSLDFDVGGSLDDNGLCAKHVLKVYKSFYSFSKHLVGAYCNNNTQMMPRIIMSSSQFIRISFEGGDNKLKTYRGFSLMIWTSHKGKTGLKSI